MRLLVVVMLAYLIGSIPFGYLIVRMSGGGDVRTTGSGGTGATNVSRKAGKAAGIVTLVLDALKGACAVWVARFALAGGAIGSGTVAGDNASSAEWIIAAAAVAAIVGHIFPVWLGFRGGKGVATAVGVFFMLQPFALLCAGIVFLAVFAPTRYVSLASIAAVTSIPLFLWLQQFFVQPRTNIGPPLTAAVVVALLIIFAHRANVARLLSGTEPKFS
jgi:glycerol-3-phosphate acyltransferase PlsY